MQEANNQNSYLQATVQIPYYIDNSTSGDFHQLFAQKKKQKLGNDDFVSIDCKILIFKLEQINYM